MFNEKAEFLTLDPQKHPEFAKIPETIFVPFNKKFCAAQFYRKEELRSGAHAKISIFADTKFRLTVNGKVLGVGPVAAGGDYGNMRPMPVQYYNEYELDISEPFIEILAEVQTPCEVMTDYSVGRGGFIFAAELTFPDGNVEEIVSDESWLVLHDVRYSSIVEADYSKVLPGWEKPVIIPRSETPWNLVKAEIPTLTEEEILPISAKKNGTRTHFVFSRIYSAYIVVDAENKTPDPAEVKIYAGEVDIPSALTEKITVPAGKSHYRGFRMWSIGEVEVECLEDVDVSVKLIYAHYPTDESVSGNFKCSDEKLNGIYDLGRFTLEMCRQSLNLDSPLHQETLGCTGDYAIETLMTAVTFGDFRLSRLDLIRTADFLKMSGGVMFHTSYSLIFVNMLCDYYEYTADIELVRKLLPTVELLFDRFDGYIEDNVIENPPNYMFIEWGVLDGFNLHHPPKALGQTSLNAFYQMSLRAAAKLYAYADNCKMSKKITEKADAHRIACREKFFDKALGIFCDGTPAPESVYEKNDWLPENPARTYHTRHASILAALSGIAEDGKSLIERVVTHPYDFERFDIQPYFMHYLMEAVRKYGLFDKYGLDLIHLWDKQLEESPKGMTEGWGEFNGDHSHAWGATPTYQLPMAFSGFEMIKPGFKEFKLSPKLFSLEFAELSLPTPYGLIRIKQEQNQPAVIDYPTAFELVRQDSENYILKLKELSDE